MGKKFPSSYDLSVFKFQSYQNGWGDVCYTYSFEVYDHDGTLLDRCDGKFYSKCILGISAMRSAQTDDSSVLVIEINIFG